MAYVQGQTIVITGASSGIGAVAARELARQGANVVIVGRLPEHTQLVAAQIDAPYYLADFTRLDEVRALADNLLENHLKIDVLINNAGGLMDGPREVTADGHETTFQVNYLAGFLLTALLMERLVASEARIINASCALNRSSQIDLDDLQSSRHYKPLAAYGAAKLMNILHVKELQRRYGSRGIRAAAFHSGRAASGSRRGNGAVSLLYNSLLGKLFPPSPQKAADTLLWLAGSVPDIDWAPGEYYEKRAIAPAHPQADDTGLARALWEASEELADVRVF